MSTIFKLLKLQIDNKTNILKTKINDGFLVNILKKLLIMGVITFAVLYVLFFIFSLGFNINEQLMAIVLLVMQVISLFFAISNVISNLYMSKDNQMLMVLPATPNQLFISKVLFIYLKEVAVNALISLPIFLSMGIIGGLDVVYYLSIPLFILILPILPIVFACFISIPVMMVIRYLRKHPILSIVLTLVFVSLVLFGYVYIVGEVVGSINIVDKQIQTVQKINEFILNVGSKLFIFTYLGKAMVSFASWWVIFVYLAACLALLFATTFIIKPLYFKVAMSELESDFVKEKVKEYKVSSPFVSLLVREIHNIFRSPGAVFEYFLFTLLMPFIVFAYDSILLSASVNEAGVNMVSGSHIMVVAILALLSNIVSASTFSREGSTFYISKIIPVNYYTQVFAKLVFNAIFTTGALLLTMIISFFMFPAWEVIVGTLAILFMSIGHIALSIDMDIKNPTINLQGNEDASKLGKNTTKSILYALFLGVIMGLIVILMANLDVFYLAYIIIAILGLAFAIYRIYILILRINLQFDKIEI